MTLVLSPWARVSEPKYKEGTDDQQLEEQVVRLVSISLITRLQWFGTQKEEVIIREMTAQNGELSVSKR